MRAEIIAAGTELLLGQIPNTNAQEISVQLARLGVDVYYHTVVGDNRERIAAALRDAFERADLVITTGGLGPTSDDITKETVAEVLGLELREDQSVLERLRCFLGRAGLALDEPNRKQALVVEGATVIQNEVGTAPGLIVERGGKIVIMLPGPPGEMRRMLGRACEFILSKMEGRRSVIVSRTLKAVGVPESWVEQQLGDMFSGYANPTVAPTAAAWEVKIRVTAKAAGNEEALSMISEVEQEIRRRLGTVIYGADEETLEEVVGRLLRSRGLTVSVAESCTAGLLSARITRVPGSSDYFLGGVSSYANSVKSSLLGVDPDLIERQGAVSEEVAKEMALGVRRVIGSDISVGITGVAGPGGGTPAKPVGTVFIALCAGDGAKDVVVKEGYFPGGRDTVRRRSAHEALLMLYQYLVGDQWSR